MPSDRSLTERILNLLRPFSANWSGTLGRGDLVIPHRDIARLVHEILAAVRDPEESQDEATEGDIFQVLSDAQRLPSLQDQVARLRASFLISKR